MSFASNLLVGRSAFIAGGTSGINLAIAQAYAAHGAKVAVMSRKPEKVDAAVATIGNGALGFAADVRDYAAVEAAMTAAAAANGPLDIIISGAAGNFLSPAAALSANGFKTVVDIDLLGSFHVFRAGFEVAAKPGASMIALSAPQASAPYVGQAHVCAAKAGIDMLVKCLALEWGAAGVRVNSIVPGPIDGTEGMARLAPNPSMRKLAEGATALGRFGTTDDVVQLALFLASDADSYITGAIMAVDGGQMLAGNASFSHEKMPAI
ncbi:MAG: SDR family oxidoreductase [Sphingomonadales bacterium]|nr:SDR family oxidoreductase [Sphingomonadales bacterium]